MRCVLRSPRTCSYVAKSGRCTERFSEALDFPDVSTAAQFCRRHKLDQVEVLMRTNEPEYDLSIPLIVDRTA